MLTNSLLFRIAACAYEQVISYQQEIDQAVLRHQIETRGQALVVRLGSVTGLQKINRLPPLGSAKPYYGTVGGAYRYSFHPMVGACELEVSNQMGGFAFFHPERFDPLHLYLFNPPEEISLSDNEDPNILIESSLCDLYQVFPENQQMVFRIPPLLYKTFTDWPWSHRPLHGYDFSFVPTTTSCLVRVTARESNVVLELTAEEKL